MKSFHTLISVFIIVIFIIVGVFTAKANKHTVTERVEKEFVYSTKKNTSEFIVKHKGQVKVTNDDKGIASITPNGYLTIEQSSFGNKRKLEFKADANGKLSREYFEGKTAGNYETDGKEWLESLLPNLIYQTAIGGHERVIRIFNEKGIRAALEEAEKLRTKEGSSVTIFIGSYSQNTNYSITNHNLYYKALIDNVKMNNDDLSEYLQSLSKMRSNSNKGCILRDVLRKYKLTPDLMEDFLETTASLDYNTERGNTLRLFISKYDITKDNYRDFFRVIDGMNINSEKGNVMKPLIENQKLSDEIFIAFLESTRRFTNNCEKAAVLRKALMKLPENSDVIDVFIDVNNSMSSPYRYLKSEINDMLLDKEYLNRNNKISKNIMLSTMKSVRNEQSNTKKSTTLRKLHASLTTDPEIIEAYFNVVNSMDNTVEEYNLLLELMEKVEMNSVWYIALYYAAEEIAKKDNKHATAAIIRASIKNMPDNKEVVNQLFDALEEIDQNSSREEIIRMLTKEKKALKHGGTLKMLRIAANIDIDIEKALALKYIANAIPSSNEEATFLFKRLADEIELKYEYNRATKN